MRTAIAIFSIVLLSGCVAQMTMTGKAYPPVEPLQVKILFKEKPKCNFEELGFISTSFRATQNYAVEEARSKAAEVGADYIMIETVTISGFNDARVSAVAYKCAPVDREKVELEHK